MDKKYNRTYRLIKKLENEAKLAREALLEGTSPYVSLHFAKMLAEEAKTEWHTQKSKE